MPAEINTGGPRVLHCDYRADCPIPIIRSASADNKGYTLTDCQDPRGITLLRWIPRILRNDHFLRARYLDGDSPSRARLYTRLILWRRRQRVACRRSRGSPVEGKPQDASGDEARINLQDGETFHPELRDSDVIESTGGVHGRNRAVVAHPRDNRWADEQKDGFRDNEALLIRRRKSLISSHRSNVCLRNDVARSPVDLEEESQCQKRSIRELYDLSLSRSNIALNREFFGKKTKRYALTKSRSYFQVALLLFLITFGQNGLFSVKKNSGLSVFTLGTVIGAVRAAPFDFIGDAGIRAERSANLSHITGASRKIQMYIKNRHLQILPDGTVNGSNDDTSDYTIFQRTSVSVGQLRIQGVATCLYLCMDSCGLLYGSREYTEDCLFNETIEQHNYNTYSSVRWSTPKKTLYLGLNRHGQPRRVQTKGRTLGRLSAYARVLTQVPAPDRVEALQRRMLGAQHNVRHHHNSHHHNLQQAVCPTLPAQEKDGRDRFRCRKRKKRKKRKRRCRPGEKPGPQCEVPEESSHNEETGGSDGPPESKRSCEGAASEEVCRRQALDTPSKKRKSRIEEKLGGANQQRQRKIAKGKKVPNAKKPNPNGGNNSQSKKPNLTNGKKKGPKRTPPSRKKSTGRIPRTTVGMDPGAATSSLSWYPGASTTPSSGTETSPRRRTKVPSSPRNSVTGSIDRSSVSRRGKALQIDRKAFHVTTTEDPILSAEESETTKSTEEKRSSYASGDDVPEDRSDLPSPIESYVDTEENSKYDSSFDDDFTTSPTTDASTLDPEDDYLTTPTVFRFNETEDQLGEDRLETTTARFPVERLAM